MALMSKFRKFTVLLLRPDYLANIYGTDTYMAWVKATDVSQAVGLAREEVFETDYPGVLDSDTESPEDYAVLAVFKGHLEDIACQFLNGESA